MNLLDLFGRDQLNDIQNRLARITGLGFITVNQQGEPMTDYTEFCDFCRHFRNHTSLHKNCRASDAASSVQAAISGSPLIYLCPCGLMEIAIPILVNNTYLGGFLCGQARCSDPPSGLLQMRPVTAQRLLQEVLDAAAPDLEQLPVYEYRKFEDIADLVNLVITLLCENKIHQAKHEQELRRRLQKQEFLEMHLLSLQRSLAETDYNALLREADEFAGQLCLFTQDLPERMELLSRTAELFGNTYPEGNGISCLQLFPLQQQDTTDQDAVSLWITQISDYIFRRRISTAFPILEPIFEYINQNLEKKLTLALLVEKCAISQTYLSRLFRTQFQISVTDYVHRRKLQLAKRFMLHQNMPVGDASLLLGYNEYTYFSKVFRKYEGITIQEWRSRRRLKTEI